MSSYIGGLPRPPMFLRGLLAFTAPWGGWFANAQVILQDSSNSGTTLQRPTTYQYIGKPYFDTTLGIPIWLKTPGTSPVWVNSAGAPV